MYGVHTHGFEGPTTINDNHRHFYEGISSADPNIPGHVHNITATTTFADGHRHSFSVNTAPAIPVRQGHIHPYMGTTTFDDGHVHYFKAVSYTHLFKG